MVATAIYSVTMVLWKETAFPLIIIIIFLSPPTQSRGQEN